MSKQNIEESVESRVCFEELEDWVREKIQGWVQELLEEEVTDRKGPHWIPFQAAALALSHTLNASFRNRLNVSLLHK